MADYTGPALFWSTIFGARVLTCTGHPGNHLHMRASVSGFAGFPSEIFTCSRSSNPRFGGSMKQHMNLHLRVPKHIHRPLDLHNYLITILPIPWNPEIWFFIRQGADTRVFANSCGSLKACGQKRTKCNPLNKRKYTTFFPSVLKGFRPRPSPALPCINSHSSWCLKLNGP